MSIPPAGLLVDTVLSSPARFAETYYVESALALWQAHRPLGLPQLHDDLVRLADLLGDGETGERLHTLIAGYPANGQHETQREAARKIKLALLEIDDALLNTARVNLGLPAMEGTACHPPIPAAIVGAIDLFVKGHSISGILQKHQQKEQKPPAISPEEATAILLKCGGDKFLAAWGLGVSNDRLESVINGAAEGALLAIFQGIRTFHRVIAYWMIVALLEKYAVNRTMAARDLGTDCYTFGRLITLAPKESPLRCFRDIRSLAVTPDSAVADSIFRHSGNRPRVAQELGITPAYLDKRIGMARHGHPVAQWKGRHPILAILRKRIGNQAEGREEELREIIRRETASFGRELSGNESAIFRGRLSANRPQKLREIGDPIGLTRERVRQIESHLREALLRRILRSVRVEVLGTDQLDIPVDELELPRRVRAWFAQAKLGTLRDYDQQCATLTGDRTKHPDKKFAPPARGIGERAMLAIKAALDNAKGKRRRS